MTFASFIAQLLNGLAGASSLFMVAAGLSLIFGVTRIVNFAHGSLLMLAMYGAYFAFTGLGIDPYLALPLLAGRQGLGIDRAGDHHAGAELFQPRALGRRDHRRHEDLGAHAERLGGGGGGDAGVAARGGDHARGRDPVGEQAVEHAARLEAAGALQLLELEPDLEVGAGESQIAAAQHPQRRTTHVRRDTRRAGLDVVAVDHTRSTIIAMPWPTPMHIVHSA